MNGSLNWVDVPWFSQQSLNWVDVPWFSLNWVDVPWFSQLMSLGFLSCEPVDEQTLCRLLHAAHQAPNVGLTQPWRFIRITDRELRVGIHSLVERERQATAAALGARADEFLRLKVEGVLEAGEVLVVALADGRERHVFGRRTLPEMDLASAACAIQNLWLAARAEGLGMGWVSMFDPGDLARLLHLPDGAKPIAILCLGHVDVFYRAPMLELEGWAAAQPLREFVFNNRWDETAPIR